MISTIRGNLCLLKKLLFLNSMSGYNKSVDDRKLSETGKDAEEKRGSVQELPFFYA